MIENSVVQADISVSQNYKALSIHSLSLSNFRNYLSARIELGSNQLVLTGHNGAGKTSILEAVSLLTPGRGLRRARLSELAYISAGQSVPNHWAVAAAVHGRQGETRVGTGSDTESLDYSDKRIVRIDGKTMRGQNELARHLSMIWLTPQMEMLFQESASSGRKFLDRLVYSFDTEHATRINEYEYAMRERNKLLAHPRYDAIWLDSLEQTMAETGAAIAGARLVACEHINHAITSSPLSFPKAHLSVEGLLESRLSSGEAAVTVEEAFKAALKTGRGQDATAGRTLIGSHRSEMKVIHTGKHMPAEACSTGEQKAMLLSIVLAQARSGMRWHGVVPILLLDELVTHLDAVRRLELFEEICQIGAQTWMTGTDRGPFKELEGKAQYIHVVEGNLNS